LHIESIEGFWAIKSEELNSVLTETMAFHQESGTPFLFIFYWAITGDEPVIIKIFKIDQSFIVF